MCYSFDREDTHTLKSCTSRLKLIMEFHAFNDLLGYINSIHGIDHVLDGNCHAIPIFFTALSKRSFIEINLTQGAEVPFSR